MKKKSMKILSFLLILVLASTSMAFAAVPEDVAGKNYETAVTTLMERGAITGDTDGLYHPEQYLNRAQACAIVVRTINPPSEELFGTATQSIPDSGFTDMEGYGWAEPYINYAVKNGITMGVGNHKFNPGGQVTSNEYITFVLRAAGYSDESLGGTWPDNYVQKAKDLNLGIGLGTVIPEYINKWMTAQFTYNALTLIDDYQKDTPDTGELVLTGLTYEAGAFDANIATYDGKPLDKDVKVYTYEAKKNYKSSMTLSTKKTDYREETVYKYKSVSTPAWILTSGGKVTQIILPYDVGFSGKIYGLINSTNTVLNGEGESVTGLDTWSAMREINWYGQKGLVVPALTAGDGTIYEMSATNGEVRNVTTTGGVVLGKRFVEITTGFTSVEDFERTRGLIGMTGAAVTYYEVKDNASVYVVQSDNTYEKGSLSQIRSGKQVRLYDISDDDYTNADIIVINK